MRDLFAIGFMLLLPQAAWAGLFTPDEITPERPFPFEVKLDAKGQAIAEPLPHNLFKTLLNEITEALVPSFPDARTIMVNGQPKQILTFKGHAKERIEARLPRAKMLSRDELVGLSADLIRLGQAGEATGLLAPQLRERSPDYRLVANLVMAHAFRGEWSAAHDRHNFLLLDVDPPVTVPSLKPEQLKWLIQLDRGPIRAWLAVHQRITLKPTTQQAPGEDAEVYPIFTDAKKLPIQFVNEAGVYEPGKLAAQERAKLPPDAIAMVQQLALWMPGDSMLLWLLAELYAADGKLAEAADAFDMCTARGLTKPKLLMEHRALVRAAYDRMPKPDTSSGAFLEFTEQPEGGPQEKGIFAIVSREQFYIVVGIFAVIALLLLIMQVRAIRRRRA